MRIQDSCQNNNPNSYTYNTSLSGYNTQHLISPSNLTESNSNSYIPNSSQNMQCPPNISPSIHNTHYQITPSPNSHASPSENNPSENNNNPSENDLSESNNHPSENN